MKLKIKLSFSFSILLFFNLLAQNVEEDVFTGNIPTQRTPNETKVFQCPSFTPVFQSKITKTQIYVYNSGPKGFKIEELDPYCSNFNSTTFYVKIISSAEEFGLKYTTEYFREDELTWRVVHFLKPEPTLEKKKQTTNVIYRDSMITFDPATYAEKIKIIEYLEFETLGLSKN